MSARRLTGLSIAVLLLLASGAKERVLAQKITSFTSSPPPIGARGMGFADAMVSDIQDVSTMYSNAAGLAYIQQYSILLNHSQERSIHAITENVSIPLSLGNKQTISFGLSARHVGYVGQSTKDEFKVFEYGYDIAYGIEVFRATSIGGGLNVRYGKSQESNLVAVSGLIGIMYTPSLNASYGAVIKGFGNGIIYSSDQVTTSLSEEKLPGSAEAGLTLRYPTIFRPLSFTISMSNEKVFRHAGVIYKGGMEFVIREILVVRGGYYFDSGTNSGSARYGTGIRFGRFSGDFSYSPHDWSDEFYRVTLAIGLK